MSTYSMDNSLPLNRFESYDRSLDSQFWDLELSSYAEPRLLSSDVDAQTLFLLGLGLTTDSAEGIANLFQISNAEVKAAAIRNGFSTCQIDRTMGNTSKFATSIKWLGRGAIVVGTGMSALQLRDAYLRNDMMGVGKAGLDIAVGLGTAAIGGLPGVVLYGIYMLMMQPVGPGTGYQHPNVFLRDNTYVAPPIMPIYKKRR